MSTLPVVVTAQDRRGLEEMIRAHRTVGDPYGDYLDALERRLACASIVDRTKVDGQVATMHSRLRIRSVSGSRSEVVQLVYPCEMNPLSGHVSVMTNLGTQLLGSRAGARIEWRAYRGMAAVWLEEVVSQPSADATCSAGLPKEQVR